MVCRGRAERDSVASGRGVMPALAWVGPRRLAPREGRGWHSESSWVLASESLVLASVPPVEEPACMQTNGEQMCETHPSWGQGACVDLPERS